MADKTTTFFKGRQLPVRAKGQLYCSFHRDEIFQLYCITCQELACIQCVSTIHRRHEIDNLKTLTPQKKERIRKFIDTTKPTTHNGFEQSLLSVDQKLKKNAEEFEKLSAAAQQQASKLKQNIDDLTVAKISLFRKMKEKNMKLLNSHKKDINTKKEQFFNFLTECEDTIQTGSDIQVHDIEKEIDSQHVIPIQVPDLMLATFISNPEPSRPIERAFGVVTLPSNGSDAMLQTPRSFEHIRANISLDTMAKCDSAAPPKATPAMVKPKSVILQSVTTKSEKYLDRSSLSQNRHSIKQPIHFKLLAEFRSSDPIGGMSALGKDMWTCCACAVDITLINNRGEAKRKIKFDNEVLGISVSPTTQNVWVQMYGGDVLELTTTEKKFRFKQDNNKLNAICITLDEHVLLGRNEELLKLTIDGKTVLSTKKSNSGQTLCKSPSSISECRITRNIAMIDGDHVLVIDKAFNELFRYRRTVPTEDHRELWPICVTYDNTGNIVVCDQETIYIINCYGEFIQQLYQKENCHYHNVATDETGTLWASSHSFEVTLLEYIWKRKI
ncbi:uncharacterized protein LOC132553871 [Ylistrum balloti]|uniref:uncharacterized protein LOC132553871 n=1 Tax=Ylistrum balloti TaxID=509963 RepID=UPI002905EED4|nr:uncharacterized protein LOC132553871 [Ylistrum balloti]